MNTTYNIFINGYCFTFYLYFLGKCKGTVLHFEEDVSSQNLCLRICQKTDKCTWFTFIESLSGCLLLADCEILDETCSDCISGESICKEDSNGINIFSCRYCVFWPVNTCLASSCGFIDPNQKRLFSNKNLINYPYRSVNIRAFAVSIQKNNEEKMVDTIKNIGIKRIITDLYRLIHLLPEDGSSNKWKKWNYLSFYLLFRIGFIILKSIYRNVFIEARLIKN